MGLEGSGKNPPKILIVDDIMINLEILESIIEEEGYQPLCALNVQEAIDIMNESLPQLILSDFSMPGMDGLEFCRLLKSNPRTRDIPFLFITVLDSTEEKEQAFRAGAVDFILKPFDRVEVLMRIKNQLDTYQMKQEMANYNRMMHKLVSEQQRQIEVEQQNMVFDISLLRDAIRDTIDNLITIELSLESDSRELQIYSEKFMDLISSKNVMEDLEIFDPKYRVYADKEIKRRIRKK